MAQKIYWLIESDREFNLGDGAGEILMYWKKPFALEEVQRRVGAFILSEMDRDKELFIRVNFQPWVEDEREEDNSYILDWDTRNGIFEQI